MTQTDINIKSKHKDQNVKIDPIRQYARFAGGSPPTNKLAVVGSDKKLNLQLALNDAKSSADDSFNS
jgi:hypothetical protein